MKIAIDGPAGAGKSTVARQIAADLGVLYIDTGAMYRALTWKVLQTGIDPGNSSDLIRIAGDTVIDLHEEAGEPRVYCDHKDVTAEIRTPEVSRLVSTIAADEGVRRLMVQKQQELAGKYDVVMDGRDITHTVLPDADHKFFLTASLEERALRRGRELTAQGYTVDLEQLQRDIEERDRRDMERSTGPLMLVPNALLIDTTDMDYQEVVRQVLRHIREG